jgi:regulation of enolase protein 1 (concanavalin A-like superfamily)
MKKSVFATLVFFPTFIYAQITFEKYFGGPLNEQGRVILKTEEGGYIIAGNTYSYGAGESDIYLVKTDEYGDTLWTRTYGDSAADYANALIEAGDGGFIIAGITETYDDQYSSIYLIKTDENGDSLWTKSYGKERYCRASDIKKTTNGGYIVAGSVQKNRPETNDFLLLKTDSNGDSLWLRTYGGGERDRAVAVLQTSDKGYIVTGYTESFGEGLEDVYTVKTDSNGIMVWDETYGGTGKDIGANIIKASDDGFIIVGYTDSYGVGWEDGYLIKINEDGDTLWTKTYGGGSSDYTNAIQRHMQPKIGVMMPMPLRQTNTAIPSGQEFLAGDPLMVLWTLNRQPIMDIFLWVTRIVSEQRERIFI